MSKILYIEILRIVACSMVIFIHTNDNGFNLFTQYNLYNYKFWLYLFISTSSCYAISIFFAISGALLFSKEESIKKNCKRILKYILLLIIFSIINYIFNIIIHNENFEFKTLCSGIYVGNLNNQLWFLYAYIAFLIMLPFLRSLAKNLSNKYYYYLFLLAIIFQGIFPICQYLLFRGNYIINPDFTNRLVLFDSMIIYPLLGYFIHNRISSNDLKKYLPFLWIINIVSIVFSCLATSFQINITGDYYKNFRDCFNVINVSTIFATCKYFFTNYKINDFIKKLIISLGRCTFGIYLIHSLIMQILPIEYIINLLNNNHMFCSFVYVLIILLICYIVIYIFNFIIKYIKLCFYKIYQILLNRVVKFIKIFI